MSNRWSLLRALPVLLALLPLATPADAPEPPRPARRLKVAVTDIKVLFSDAQVEALLSEVALTEAASFRRLETVGRSDINGMLSFERQRQLLGCTEDAGCLAEIGGALGVDYLLLGTGGKIGTMYRIDLKLIDSNRARVVGRTGVSMEGGVEELVAATQAAVHRLLLEIVPDDPAAARPVVRARWPGWVTLGAGTAALAGGVWAGLAARSHYDALKKTQGSYGYSGSYPAKADEIRRLTTTSNILLGAGAVGLGLGTWLWWRARPAELPKVQVAVSPVGSDGVGLLAAGRF